MLQNSVAVVNAINKRTITGIYIKLNVSPTLEISKN